MKRYFDALNWMLVLVMVAFAIWAWPHLPDQIPTHFGIRGAPDAWSDKSVFRWFVIPGVGIGLAGSLWLLRRLLPCRPGWVNLPDRRCLSELPEPCQEHVVRMLSGFLAMVQTELLVIFGLIQWASYRTAMGTDSQAIMILVLFLAVLTSPFLVIVFFLRLQGAMSRGMEAARKAEAGKSSARKGEG